MQRRQKATNDADAAAAERGVGRRKEGGWYRPSTKPRPGPAPKITHNLWPLRVRRSHLASCNAAMRCAGKIYGASSAAAPRGIYVEIISVNILYLINMVHSSSSTVRAAAGRGRGELWTVVLTKAAHKKIAMP